MIQVRSANLSMSWFGILYRQSDRILKLHVLTRLHWNWPSIWYMQRDVKQIWLKENKGEVVVNASCTSTLYYHYADNICLSRHRDLRSTQNARCKTFSSLLISISVWVLLLFELQDIVTNLQKEDRQKSHSKQGELGSQTWWRVLFDANTRGQRMFFSCESRLDNDL